MLPAFRRSRNTRGLHTGLHGEGNDSRISFALSEEPHAECHHRCRRRCRAGWLFVVRQRDAAHRAEHHPYRITVVQGNFVSQEKAAQLQVGMSREQVRALLGTRCWPTCSTPTVGTTSLLQARLDGSRPAARSRRDVLGRSPGELDGRTTCLRNSTCWPISTATVAARRRRRPQRRRRPPRLPPPRAPRKRPRARRRRTLSPARPPCRRPLRWSTGCERAGRPRGEPRDQPGVGAGFGFAPVHAGRESLGRRAVPGGQPPGAAPAIQPQFQFHRPPQPNASNEAAPPVGPQGSDNLQNQPLTAPAQ